MNIDKIIDDIIEREGGYINHPNDKGGPTKYGITQRTLSTHLGKDASIDDVKGVSKELAASIYKNKYFLKYKFDKLPEDIQPFILDGCVNHGPDDPVIMLQQVLNAAKFPCGVVDGVCGPKVRGAAYTASEVMGDYLLKALIEQRRMFYLEIVDNDPTQEDFLDGWLNRLKEFM